MADVTIQVEGLWKKFRKGEIHDSLRDLIPAMCRRMLGRQNGSYSLSAQEFWALRDINFQAKRGESLGIIGPNGAGKSTMLKLLSRILTPTRGAARIHGRVNSLVEVGAGFHPELTGRENIYLNGIILGMKKKEIVAKEEQIIDFSGVEEFIETPVKRYSSGMKARLGFAVAAHMEPDILLVDEVLSVGDVKFRQKCLHRMLQMVESDITVVFISHAMGQVRQLCARTIVLAKGNMIFDGPTDNAVQAYMDALNESNGEHQGTRAEVEAEVRNVRICDGNGNPVPNWRVREPGEIHCDLVLYKPVTHPSAVFKFNDISGRYFGGDGSFQSGLRISSMPGIYHVRYRLDSVPMLDGDYVVIPCVYDEVRKPTPCIWQSSQGIMFAVRGDKPTTSVVDCTGKWFLDDAPTV